MCACVRACVHVRVYFVTSVLYLQGYQGMVDGGEDNIKEASWESVSSMLQVVRRAVN